MMGMLTQSLTLSCRLLHKLQNHLLLLFRFSDLKRFPKDDEMELASSRQIILHFSSFKEEGKQDSHVTWLTTEVEMMSLATRYAPFNYSSSICIFLGHVFMF